MKQSLEYNTKVTEVLRKDTEKLDIELEKGKRDKEDKSELTERFKRI